MMLYKKYPPLKRVFKLYFIDEAIAVPGLGEVYGVTVKDEKAACISKPGYNNVSPAHELLHCLSLHEVFPNDDDPDNPSKNGTHTFKKASTDNIMDYDWNNDNIEDRKSLWYWQMKQLWAYLKGLGS